MNSPQPLDDNEMRLRKAIESHAITGNAEWPALPTWSIKQPWAWAILHAGKDRENRPRCTGGGFGWHYIHASAGKVKWEEELSRAFILETTEREITEQAMEAAPRGAIVGAFLLAGWTDEDEGSDWFVGPKALRIIKTIAFPTPIPAKGQLGLWTFPRTQTNQTPCPEK